MKHDECNRVGKGTAQSGTPASCGGLMENRHRSDSRGRGPARIRHFAERIDGKPRLLRFVCETRPLITLRSYDLPKRCPLCSQNHPIPKLDTKEEPNAD
jgi:hypothetical protein